MLAPKRKKKMEVGASEVDGVKSIKDYLESADAAAESILGILLKGSEFSGAVNSSDEEDDTRRDDHVSAVAPTSPLMEALTAAEQLHAATEDADALLAGFAANRATFLAAEDDADDDAEAPPSPVSCHSCHSLEMFLKCYRLS